jgi:transposase
MAYREVGMFEVKEVLRLYMDGAAKKAVARMVGVDIKTVRRYVALAEALEMEPPLTDAKLAELFAALRTTQERERGQAWHDCEAHREAIKKWLEQKVRLTKVRKLLQRHHQVAIPYSTLHRFAVAELEFGRRGQRSVRLVDGEPGQELQVDTGWVVTLTVGQKRIRKKAFIFTPNVSRYRFVYPIESETTETAIKACEAAWTFYGGVFAVLLPDNTKAIRVG